MFPDNFSNTAQHRLLRRATSRSGCRRCVKSLVLGSGDSQHLVGFSTVFSAFRTFGEMILMQLLFQSDSTLKKAALFGCPSPGDCYLPVLLSDLYKYSTFSQETWLHVANSQAQVRIVDHCPQLTRALCTPEVTHDGLRAAHLTSSPYRLASLLLMVRCSLFFCCTLHDEKLPHSQFPR